MVAVLHAFGFGSLGLAEQDSIQPDHIIQLGYPPNRIDLLTSISGVSFDEAWQSREGGMLDEIPVNYIGRKTLVRNKLASGRLKDAADVEALGESPER